MDVSSVQNNSKTKYKKPGIGTIIGGVLAGGTINSATVKIGQSYSAIPMNKIKSMCSNLSKDEFKQTTKAISDAIKKTGLDKKGVEIIYASADNAKEIDEIVLKEFQKGFARFLPKQLKNIQAKGCSSMVQDGANAFYTFVSKKVILPKEGLSLSAFHEIGHAMNANLSTFGKMLQNCRQLSFLAIPIALIAMYKTKKAEGEQPKNKLDKATDFIKNNAGKLTFLTFVPMLLEEGLASIKGSKLAKELLSPELFKKVTKFNALAYTTYLATAVLSAVGIALGVKLKDKIAHKKVEQNK